MLRSTLWCLSGAFTGFVIASSASAGPVYSFQRLTNVADSNVASQLSVEVNDEGGDQVSFLFRNAVGISSSICDVYFDDGTLLGISNIISSTGVVFQDPATPGNLPGGNNASPAFLTSQDFSADSDPPVEPKGVDHANEWLKITFDLIDGKTYADTLQALARTDTDQDNWLRIGLHVQAIGSSGRSDSYLNNVPPTVVPLPAGVFMGGSLLGGLGLIGVYRRRDRLA